MVSLFCVAVSFETSGRGVVEPSMAVTEKDNNFKAHSRKNKTSITVRKLNTILLLLVVMLNVMILVRHKGLGRSGDF